MVKLLSNDYQTWLQLQSKHLLDVELHSMFLSNILTVSNIQRVCFSSSENLRGCKCVFCLWICRVKFVGSAVFIVAYFEFVNSRCHKDLSIWLGLGERQLLSKLKFSWVVSIASSVHKVKFTAANEFDSIVYTLTWFCFIIWNEFQLFLYLRPTCDSTKNYFTTSL